jgi:hypothetical protein
MFQLYLQWSGASNIGAVCLMLAQISFRMRESFGWIAFTFIGIGNVEWFEAKSDQMSILYARRSHFLWVFTLLYILILTYVFALISLFFISSLTSTLRLYQFNGKNYFSNDQLI